MKIPHFSEKWGIFGFIILNILTSTIGDNHNARKDGNCGENLLPGESIHTHANAQDYSNDGLNV